MKYLLNVGKIIAFLKAIRDLVGEVASRDVQPETVNRAIEGLQTLLYSGVIDIPGVNEDDLARAIQDARNQFPWTKAS